MSMFVKAVRKKAKLRMALTGVSGSGKTLGALYIAYGMTKDWGKIAVLDTEHDRALFYANREDLGTGEFLHCTMTPPYSPEPVSYTHLDVYKRQQLSCWGARYSVCLKQ